MFGGKDVHLGLTGRVQWDACLSDRASIISPGCKLRPHNVRAVGLKGTKKVSGWRKATNSRSNSGNGKQQ